MTTSDQSVNRAESTITLLSAMIFFIGLSATTPASAQFYATYGYYAGPIPRISIPQVRAMHPAFILEDLEARGFSTIGVPARRGDVYIVDALSHRREPIRLIVDAYDGEILERFSRDDRAVRSTPRLQADGPGRETKRATADRTVAELPAPPRRPGIIASQSPGAASTPGQQQASPKAVAPARKALDWAPINSVPVAPLD